MFANGRKQLIKRVIALRTLITEEGEPTLVASAKTHQVR